MEMDSFKSVFIALVISGALIIGAFFLQGVTGLLGAGLHSLPLLEAEVATRELWDALRYGPPVFAPLLFVDLAALAALGLWDLQAKVEALS